jgi:hypothetical protein
MDHASASDVLARIDAMRASVTDLGTVLRSGSLDEADERYLSRCIDLLEMELAAIREYLVRLA